MNCNRCGAPMSEEIGLGHRGELQAVWECRCGAVEPLFVRWDRAEVQRRIRIIQERAS